MGTKYVSIVIVEILRMRLCGNIEHSKEFQSWMVPEQTTGARGKKAHAVRCSPISLVGLADWGRGSFDRMAQSRVSAGNLMKTGAAKTRRSGESSASHDAHNTCP